VLPESMFSTGPPPPASGKGSKASPRKKYWIKGVWALEPPAHLWSFALIRVDIHMNDWTTYTSWCVIYILYNIMIHTNIHSCIYRCNIISCITGMHIQNETSSWLYMLIDVYTIFLRRGAKPHTLAYSIYSWGVYAWVHQRAHLWNSNLGEEGRQDGGKYWSLSSSATHPTSRVHMALVKSLW
jgi:hypothetical protein